MPTTEKDLAQKRDKIEKTREELAKVQSERLEAEANASAEVTGALLDAEQARLNAELQRQKETTKVAKSGGTLPLEQARAQMQAALAQQDAEKKAAKGEAVEVNTADVPAPGDGDDKNKES